MAQHTYTTRRNADGKHLVQCDGEPVCTAPSAAWADRIVRVLHEDDVAQGYADAAMEKITDADFDLFMKTMG